MGTTCSCTDNSDTSDKDRSTDDDQSHPGSYTMSLDGTRTHVGYYSPRIGDRNSSLGGRRRSSGVASGSSMRGGSFAQRTSSATVTTTTTLGNGSFPNSAATGATPQTTPHITDCNSAPGRFGGKGVGFDCRSDGSKQARNIIASKYYLDNFSAKSHTSQRSGSAEAETTSEQGQQGQPLPSVPPPPPPSRDETPTLLSQVAETSDPQDRHAPPPPGTVPSAEDNESPTEQCVLAPMNPILDGGSGGGTPRVTVTTGGRTHVGDVDKKISTLPCQVTCCGGSPSPLGPLGGHSNISNSHSAASMDSLPKASSSSQVDDLPSFGASQIMSCSAQFERSGVASRGSPMASSLRFCESNEHFPCMPQPASQDRSHGASPMIGSCALRVPTLGSPGLPSEEFTSSGTGSWPSESQEFSSSVEIQHQPASPLMAVPIPSLDIGRLWKRQ